MRKLCLIIYILSLLITGCTHIRKYSTLGELNSKIKDKKAKIVLKDEQELIGKDIYITPDSTSWIDPDTENKRSINTSDVNSIVIENFWRGVLEGFGMGFLIGTAVVLVSSWNIIGSIYYGGIGGLQIGALIGVARDSKDKFIFENREKISIFNVDLSSPLAPNSVIKLEVPPHDILSIKNILEYELSSKGFDITEGFANYTIRFSYSMNEQKRLCSYTANIQDMATDKIIEVVNYRSNPFREVIITETDIIKEFVNQLCPEMK